MHDMFQESPDISQFIRKIYLQVFLSKCNIELIPRLLILRACESYIAAATFGKRREILTLFSNAPFYSSFFTDNFVSRICVFFMAYVSRVTNAYR